MEAWGTGSAARRGYLLRRTSWLCTCAALLVLALASSSQAALSSVPDDDWVTNGPVYAMARSGSTIYLGGSFSQIGPRTGPAVSFSGSSSTPDASFPQVSGGAGAVGAVVNDGAGGWYIGGSFTHVGAVARKGLAHILSGGMVDPNFAPEPEVAGGLGVSALALSGSTLYVGGSFFAINGVARHGLAALSTADGSLQSWNPTPTGGGSAAVAALTISGGTLYVGGVFTTIVGQPRSDLAAFTVSSGELTSWAPNVTGAANPSVKALAVQGATIYLAGAFDHVGGSTRAGFAAVDTTGALTSWNPDASEKLGPASGFALAATATTVYASGFFNQIGGQSRSSLAALDPTTGKATSWNPAASGGLVEGMAVVGSTVYVSGAFTNIGGQARNGLAALDTTTAAASSWNPNLNLSPNPAEATEVFALADDGSHLVVGGDFSSVGGVARSDLAAIDATSGEATSWNPGVVPVFKIVNQPVRALSVAGGVVYVGGSFSQVGGQSRENLAALDPTTGDATSWNPGAGTGSIENAVVGALVATPQTVYVGGTFTSLGGLSRSNLGAVSAATGSATGWSPQLSAVKADTEHGVAAVYTLALSGATLYVGGGLSGLGGLSRAGAGAVDIETASPTSWAPVVAASLGQSPYVTGLAVSGSTAYIGDGQFGLLTVDASGGAALPFYAPMIDHSRIGYVQSVATANSAVYLAGAGFDAGSGLALAWDVPLSNFTFGTPTTTATVLASGNHVYLGGNFRTSEYGAASGFAAFTITGPVNTAPPMISGAAAEGQTLTEHHGSWTGSPSSYSYQWVRCVHHQPAVPCAPIVGATQPTYTLSQADVGSSIDVEETATNGEGASDAVGSAPTAAVIGPPINLTPPTVSGSPQVGQTLSCSTGSWSNSPSSYHYAWLRDFEFIPGATSASYTVSASDVSHELFCLVTATNPAGDGQASTYAGVGAPGTDEEPKPPPLLPPGGGDPGNGGGSTGGGTGNPPGPGPAGVPASAIRAALAGMLKPKGTLPTAASLLAAGAYRLSFTAPSPGVLTVRWTVSGAQASRITKPVLVASGSKSFSASGRGVVKIRLSGAGRKLMKKHRALKVVETGIFTPSGGSAQTGRATLTIKGRRKR